jgi:hypothetical protein
MAFKSEASDFFDYDFVDKMNEQFQTNKNKKKIIDIYVRAVKAIKMATIQENGISISDILHPFTIELDVLDDTDLSVDFGQYAFLDYCFFGVYGNYWHRSFDKPSAGTAIDIPMCDNQSIPQYNHYVLAHGLRTMLVIPDLPELTNMIHYYENKMKKCAKGALRVIALYEN